MNIIKEREYPKLHSIIFGEGIFNDAVAILLFKAVNILILVSIFSSTFFGLIRKKHEDQSFFSVGGIVKLLWEFLKLSTESLLIGVILGFTLSLLMKMMKV